MRLSDLADIATNQPEANFWLIRRGSEKEVGRPVDEYDPERIGVRVTRTDILLPRYLFYVFMDLHARGYWIPRAHGTTRLVNIKVSDVKNLALAPQGSQGMREERMGDEPFAQRYMITSLTGRIWNRAMVRRAAMDQVRTSSLPGLRGVPASERAALVDSVLDDDAWMRRYAAGMIPQRVVEAIEDRVWELVRGAGAA
jgi:hypothetical protein